MILPKTVFLFVFIFLLQVIALGAPKELLTTNKTDESTVPPLNSSDAANTPSIPSVNGSPSFKLQSFQSPSILFLVGDENSLTYRFAKAFQN